MMLANPPSARVGHVPGWLAKKGNSHTWRIDRFPLILTRVRTLRTHGMIHLGHIGHISVTIHLGYIGHTSVITHHGHIGHTSETRLRTHP